MASATTDPDRHPRRTPTLNRLVDRVTARALALALRASVDVEEAARSVAELAAGNILALRLALARIQRGNQLRTGPVGTRAANVLRLALATA